MMDFVTSSGGRYFLYSIAVAMQLIGATLVIRDVRRSSRLSNMFATAVDTHGRAFNDLSQGEEFDQLVSLAVHGHEDLAALSADDRAAMKMFAPMIATDLRARYSQNMTDMIVAYNKEKGEQRWWVSWIGPVALLVGIAVNYFAAMTGVG